MTKTQSSRSGKGATGSRTTVLQWVATAGLLLIAAAIVIPLLTGNLRGEAFRYVYVAGALLVLAGRLFSPYRGNDMRIKRLHRIESWAALFFCAGAVFLFYPGASMRDALAFTLAGGAIQIFTSIMIPRASSAKGKERG